jgi:hypothetical protein
MMEKLSKTIIDEKPLIETNSMKTLQTLMMKPSDIQARIVKWMDVIGN